ncbi:retrovirus-related pol polyprotein from transposon TNT 1-94 [Tanacetum coccineum]
MQLNQEFFQKDKSCVKQNAPEIQEYFKQNDLQAQLHTKDTIINKLKETIYSLRDNANPAKVKRDIDEIETINIELEHSMAKLLFENEKLHKEKEHLKKTYKELYDSIKPTRVRAKEQELKGKDLISTAVSKPNATTIAPGMYKLELEPLPPKVLQNKDAHMNYIKHSREHADILRDIVESARALSPLDSNLDSACKYVQRIQEVLVYVKDKFPCLKKLSEKLVAVTPKNKDKKVRFADLVTPSSNTQKQVDSHKTKDSNQPLLYSTGVICSTGASGSKSTGNKKTNRISQSSSSNKTNKVEDQSRSVKSRTNKKNCVSKTECNADVIHSMLNANSESVCAICNECLFDSNHDKCVLDYVHDVNVLSKSKPTKRKNKKQIWKHTGKVYTDIGYKWKPTGQTFTIVRNKCLLTRFTSTKVVPLKETTIKSVLTPLQELSHSKLTQSRGSTVSTVPSSSLIDFRLSKLFSGVDLLMGSRGTNLYTLSIGDMMKSSPICLLSKASKTKSWLWHRRLSHLNFGTINQLAKQGLVRGLPKLKFEKDHLYSACSLGKSKKHSHKPKSEDTNQEKLYLLHMDLCGPMRVESINGKKYILVIVDEYSRFTWVKFLRSKDEAPKFIIKFLKTIQVRLNAFVRNIRTDNGTEFVNQTLRIYYEDFGAGRTMLIYAKAPLFLWTEAVATACYTQNRSLIRLCHVKTPYELLHDKKPDLSYLYVFGALCYPTNDSEDLGKLKAKANVGIFIGYAHAKKAYWIYNKRTKRIMETIHVDFDELTTMASEQSSLGPVLQEMTLGTLSSGLVPNHPSLTPYVPPTRIDRDTLFQPLFDEYFNLPPSIDHLVPEVVAPEPAISTGTASSTSVDQDAPSPSTLQTSQESPSQVIPSGAEEADHDIEVAHMDNDPYFCFSIPEPSSEESSS